MPGVTIATLCVTGGFPPPAEARAGVPAPHHTCAPPLWCVCVVQGLPGAGQGQAVCLGRGSPWRLKGPQSPRWRSTDAAPTQGPNLQAGPAQLAALRPRRVHGPRHTAVQAGLPRPSRLGDGCASWLGGPELGPAPRTWGLISVPHTLLLEPAPSVLLAGRYAARSLDSHLPARGQTCPGGHSPWPLSLLGLSPPHRGTCSVTRCCWIKPGRMAS